MITFNNEQIYIVTGASSGLGEATALLLNELGATVIAIARNEKRLLDMKKKCKNPENMHIEITDLTDDIEKLPQYIRELKEKYGKFSGMAYCAGISNIIPLRALDFTQLDYTYKINYYAPILMIKGLVDKRNNIGEGTSIVAISSIASKCSDKGHIAYAGSKAALCASLKSISKEVITNGIRVNCVLPSNIKTPMTAMDGYEESQKGLYPLGFGETNDVANMIIYLLSDKAKFISGQNYIIDSGGVL
ncbi:MAG: SDR family oxidoreductase [Alphaproteobacteria bacterium]|nr:SDR family oxidoreductase [Alphaproteobacteria bacterium]